MKLSSQIKPISYLKAHAAEIVRTLGDQSEPLIITQNGEAKAVMQDIDSYEQIAGNGCAVSRSLTLALGSRDRLEEIYWIDIVAEQDATSAADVVAQFGSGG